MKLLFVLEDLLVGGAQRHSVDLADRLQARGFKVEVMVLGAEVAAALAGDLHSTPTVLAQTGLSRPTEWRRIGRAIRSACADVVVAVGPVATCVAAATRPAPGGERPALASIHHATQVGSIAGWLRTGPFLLAARRCDALVFVSRMQRAYWDRRGLRSSRVDVIRNGVDCTHYATPVDRDRSIAKAALGLSTTRLTLCAVAMFRPEKNHSAMLQALAALLARGVDAELLLVGDGPTRPAVQMEAERSGLAPRVRFCGLQADVRPFIAASDVGVFASTRIETLPLSGLELMAAGAPLVAPRIGGLEELVEDGEDGLLYPPGNTTAFVRQLQRCADPATRLRLGRAAVRKAARFSIDVMADAYASLATDLVAARAA